MQTIRNWGSILDMENPSPCKSDPNLIEIGTLTVYLYFDEGMISVSEVKRENETPFGTFEVPLYAKMPKVK